MAEYWLSTLGSNANSGIGSAANAKRFFHTDGVGSGAISLLTSKNDILNVVADGNHTWTLSATGTSIPGGTKGTSFTDYGTLIRGTTSLGAPAFATIQALAIDGNANRTLIRTPHNTGYIIFRNIVFDSTPLPADGSFHRVVTWHDSGSPDPGPTRFEGCRILGASLGSQPAGNRYLQEITAAPTAPDGALHTEFFGCYFQNARGEQFAGANLAAEGVHFVDYCVIYNDWNAASLRFYGLGPNESALANLRFVNNHVYMSHGANLFVPVIDFDAGSGTNVGNYDCYNNVVYCESSHADPDIIFMGGGGVGTTTRTGTIDYNVLVGGPSVAAGDIHDTQGWYEAPWDEGADPKTNDIVTYATAEATIFNNPAGTYAWDPLGNGVTITIPKDLRLKAPYDALGLGSILRGALPGLGIDMVVDIATDNATPLPLEAFTVTVTASCTGGNATGVTYTCQIPTGITFLSATTNAGSYAVGSGVWTIGNLTEGFPKTLQITVKPRVDTEDQAITFLAAVTAFTPSTDTNLSNNTDSVTIMVGSLEKRLGDGLDNEKVLASETSNEKVLAPE